MRNLTKSSFLKSVALATGVMLNFACDSSSSSSDDAVSAAEAAAGGAASVDVADAGSAAGSDIAPSPFADVLGLVEEASAQAELGEKRTGTGAAAYILPYVVGNGDRKTNINLSNISTGDITVHVAYINLKRLDYPRKQKCDECDFLLKMSGWDVVGLEFDEGIFRITDQSKWYDREKDREYRTCIAPEKVEYAEGFVILTVEEGDHLLEETSTKNVLLAEVSVEEDVENGYGMMEDDARSVASYRPYAGRAIKGAQDEDLRTLSWGTEYVSLPMLSGGSIRTKTVGSDGYVETRIVAVNPYFESGAIDPNESKLDVSLFDHDEGGLSSKSIHYTCGVRFELHDLIPEVAPGEIGGDNSGTRVLFQIANTTQLPDDSTLMGGALCVIEEQTEAGFSLRSCHESAKPADDGDTVLKDAKGDDWNDTH